MCCYMRVAHELADAGYPREVGPGVYDIHSPRVPDVDEVVALLRKGLEGIAAERLCVKPRLRPEDARLGRGTYRAGKPGGCGSRGARQSELVLDLN